ncbi:SPASM domain-containing protein [Candidatus Bipolaricaulota bacterium]|nr:SPASM domain-containing protein [Candidatus Bipolaricaulota bacterium]
MTKPSRYNIYIPANGESDYVLYNSLSNALFRVNKRAIRAIQRVEKHQLDGQLMRALKDSRIWVEDDVDERAIFQTFHERYKYSGARAYLCLYVTYQCNLACEYCYLEYFMKGKSTELMKVETARAAAELAKRTVQDNNCAELVIVFTGGEPLLNIPVIDEVLGSLSPWAEARDIELMSIIFSNGTTPTERILDALSKYNLFFQITLAGAKDIHNKKRPYKRGGDTYEDIIMTLTLLRKHQVPFGIRVDVDRENYTSIAKMLDDLRENVGEEMYIKFFPIIPGAEASSLSWTSSCLALTELGELSTLWRIARAKGFKVMLTPLKKYVYCDYLTNRGYIVDPLGDVYKCGGAVGVKERRIGTLDSQGKIREATHWYYDWMTRSPLTVNKCRNCKFLPTCGGGCAGVAYDKHKTYHREDCREKYLTQERVKFYLEEVENAQSQILT